MYCLKIIYKIILICFNISKRNVSHIFKKKKTYFKKFIRENLFRKSCFRRLILESILHISENLFQNLVIEILYKKFCFENLFRNIIKIYISEIIIIRS